jgi:hypothetical protein
LSLPPKPPQPTKEQKKSVGKNVKGGRGKKGPTATARGVAIEDLTFMAAVVESHRKTKDAMMRVTDKKDKAREKEVEKDRGTLKLRGEREEATLKAGRLEREKERGGMEGQMLGWKQRALKAEDEAERQLKESKGRERELLRETREEKAKQHGFVQQLQDRMEIGGMQMHCTEKGNEGLFVPKNQMHVQLKAWEEEAARKRKELEEKDTNLEEVSGKLLAVLGDLRSEKSDHSQMQQHAVALERTVKSLSMRNKEDVQAWEGKMRKEQKKVAKAEAVHRTEISSCESRVEKCEGNMSDANAAVANAKAAHATLLLGLERAFLSLQASTDAASAKERQLRAMNDSRVKDLEKFRLSTARLKERESKQHTRGWSKVPTHKHPGWFQNKMAVMEEQILQLMELEDDHKTAVEVNKASADEKPDALLEILGRPGDRHSLEAVGLGIEVMSHGMSAQTARDTIRSFVNRIYPKAKCRASTPASWGLVLFRSFLLAPHHVTHQSTPNLHPVIVSFTGAVLVCFRLAPSTRFSLVKKL